MFERVHGVTSSPVEESVSGATRPASKASSFGSIRFATGLGAMRFANKASLSSRSLDVAKKIDIDPMVNTKLEIIALKGDCLLKPTRITFDNT